MAAMPNTEPDPQVAPAYQVWHCGRLGCDNELESRDDSTMSCPNCECVFETGTGQHIPDDEDEDYVHPDDVRVDDDGRAFRKSNGDRLN